CSSTPTPTAPWSSPAEQGLDERPDLLGDLPGGALAVEDEHAVARLELEGGLLVGPRDPLLLRERLEELGRLALAEPARERDLGANLQKERAIGGGGEAVEGADPLPRRGHALVRLRGEDVAVADHVDARLQGRSDLPEEVIEAICREEERQGAAVPIPTPRGREPALEDRPKLPPHRPRRRLRREEDLAPALLDPAGQELRLGRGPGAVEPLEYEK